MMHKAPLCCFSKRFEVALNSSKPLFSRAKPLTRHTGHQVFAPKKPQLQHRCYSTRGFSHENVQLDWLKSFDMQVNGATYAKLLRLAASAHDLVLGRRLHIHMMENGHGLTILLCNLLIHLYGKCGALDDAMAIFDSMCVRNEFSWTLIMEAYALQGHFEKAAQVFGDMGNSSIIPDKVTFIIMISACADEAALDEGKRLHSGLVEGGHDSDVIVGNSLVNMYGKCCSLQDARSVFTSTQARTLVSWNTIIRIYFDCEQVEEALQLFQQMHIEGVLPDKYTYVSILNVPFDGVDLAEGKRLHSLLVQNVFQWDMVVGTALTKMYSSHGSLVESRRLFDTMQMRDLVAWNAMIAAYAQHAQGTDVLGLSQQMLIEGAMLDDVTFLVLLSACADLRTLDVGKRVHVRIVNMNYESDVSVGNNLITMYGKCGKINQAQKVFDKMPERDVVSWNTLITAYVQQGQVPSKLPLRIFKQMQIEGVISNKITFVGLFDMCCSRAHAADCSLLHTFILGSDLELDGTVGNAIVNAYGKCGNVWEAQKMFHKMLERDEFAWNAMIAAHAQEGESRGAIELLHQMRMEGMLANKVTYVSIIDTCANDVNLSEGKRVHIEVVGSSFETDTAIATALSDMYGKCGIAEDACSSFNIMPGRDVVSWNAMGKVFSQHGLGMEALEHFEKIRLDMAPNNSTFSSLLGACSHAGLVCEGCYCFILLTEEYDMTPTLKHYNILIDLLGRAGQLDEIEALLYRMPCQPSATSWLTLLDVCRKYSDASLGSRVAEHVFELGGANAAALIMLSNICALSNLGAAQL